MTSSMLDVVAISDFWWSGSEASDMLSADTVVGGVELMDVEFDDDESVGSLLVKLDPHSSSESSSAIAGVGSSVAAIVVAMVVCD
jgi:beta-galactosidase GanA